MNDYTNMYTADDIAELIGHKIVASVIYKRPILHLSHTDLDGYACNHVLDMLPQFIWSSEAREHMSQNRFYHYDWRFNDERNTITHYNTNKLNDRMFEVLDPLSIGYLTAHRNLKPILLITDISNFDLNRLIMHYGKQFDIIVLDHHQWNDLKNDSYFKMTNRKVTDSINELACWTHELACWTHWDVNYDGTNLKTGARGDTVTRIYDTDVLVYVNSDHSATKLLMDIVAKELRTRYKVYNYRTCKEIIAYQWTRKVLANVSKIADYVSAYDTGNFGNWYLDPDGKGEVSIQTAMNRMIYKTIHNPMIHGNDQVHNHAMIMYEQRKVFDWVYRLIKSGLPANSAAFDIQSQNEWNESRDLYLALCEDMMDEVQEDFSDISNDYEIWKETTIICKIQKKNIYLLHPEIEEDLNKMFAIIRRIKNLPDGEYILRYSNGHEHYPMFMYAKQVLTENNNATAFIHITDNRDTKTIHLATVRDDIDLAKIAAENGGGGHIKAAGFTMH